MHIRAKTLGGAIDASVKQNSDRPALSFNGTISSYKTLDAAASRLANAYQALGVSRGDRVLCQLPNHPEFLIAAMAAWKQGAVHVGLDRDLTPPEVGRTVELLTPTVVLTYGGPGRATAQFVSAAHNSDPHVQVVVCDEGDPARGYYSLSDVMAAPADAGPWTKQALKPDEPALILLTSGTTGTPKSVIRYHGQLLDHWTKTAELLRASPSDRHLVQLPLSYGFGFGLAVAGLLTGGTLVLVDRFSPEETLQLVAGEQITVLNGTPTHFRLLLDRLDPMRHDVSSLRAGAGSAARFPPPLLERIFDTLGLDFVHTYGCSEGLGWKTRDKDELLRGSIGRPPSDRARIVGPDRRPLAPGEIGEIAVHKTHAVHYWQETSGATRDPNWHYTGDRGTTDEVGHMYVLGRVNDQINRGGHKIDAGEVESALSALRGLADATVIAVPDRVQGEIVCACVVSETTAQPGLQEIRDLLAPSLAGYKLPEMLCLLDHIPRTRVGKIDRPALQSAVASGKSRTSTGTVVQERWRPDNS